MKWNVGTKIALGFGLAIVIFVIVGGLSYQSATHQAEEARWVAHTHEVQATLMELLTNLTDAETGQRGFIITGERSYLQPYESALGELGRAYEDLRRRMVAVGTDEAQLRRLDAGIQQRLA